MECIYSLRVTNIRNKKEKYSLSYVCDFFLILLLFLMVTNTNNLINLPFKDYVLIILIGIYCILNFKYLFSSKKLYSFIFWACAYAIWAVFVGLINRGITIRDSFLASIVYSAECLELILSIIILYNKNKSKDIIFIWTKLKTIYVIAIIIQLFYFKIFLGDSEFDNYVYGGNNFSTCYFIAEWVCFVLLNRSLNNKKNSLTFKIILCVPLLFAAFVTTASTCIIAGLFFCMLLVLTHKSKQSIITTPFFFCFLFVFSALFIFIYSFFLKMEFVQNVFLMLGESLDMTRRTLVYDGMIYMLRDHVLLGYGYGSQNEIISSIYSIYDAQNGFWNLVFSVGLIGAVMYGIFMALPFLKLKSFKHQTLPMCCYIYFIIIVALVEIPYSASFLSIPLLLYISNLELNKRRYLE